MKKRLNQVPLQEVEVQVLLQVQAHQAHQAHQVHQVQVEVLVLIAVLALLARTTLALMVMANNFITQKNKTLYFGIKFVKNDCHRTTLKQLKSKAILSSKSLILWCDSNRPLRI